MENIIIDKGNLDSQYSFWLEMDVRDYELDCEKIVNNANYLHYMEHTRHKFCENVGFPFREMVEKDIIVVVRKVELEYFSPLKSGDRFISALRMERKGAQFIFIQDILSSEGQIKVKGKISVVSIVNGKLSRGDELASHFTDFLN